MGTIQDTDLFIVNRGGTDYKITAKDVKEHFDTNSGPPVPTFVTANVGSDSSNWSQYVELLSYPDLNVIPDSEFFYWPKENRNPDRIFNGDPSVGYDAACNTENILIFAPDDGIQVYDSITIKAGFNDNVNYGVMEINGGERFEELFAPNLSPREFTISYEGTLENFSIRQRDEYFESSFNKYSWSPSIHYIKIDGNQLLNQQATTLTFEPGEFFDLIKVGTQLQQVSPEVTGVVSKIDADDNKVVLDDVYLLFETGSTINIVGADPL